MNSKAKNNITYVLSYVLSSHSFEHKPMYIRYHNSLNQATSKLGAALIFKSKKQAKTFLRNNMISSTWSAKPISSKIIFKARLKGI